VTAIPNLVAAAHKNGGVFQHPAIAASAYRQPFGERFFYEFGKTHPLRRKWAVIERIAPLDSVFAEKVDFNVFESERSVKRA
jgi:hypothetical protein